MLGHVRHTQHRGAVEQPVGDDRGPRIAGRGQRRQRAGVGGRRDRARFLGGRRADGVRDSGQRGWDGRGIAGVAMVAGCHVGTIPKACRAADPRLIASKQRIHRRMAGSVRESPHDKRLVSNYFIGNEGTWGCRLCALRRAPAYSSAASCSAIARPGLLRRTRAAGTRFTDDRQSSKGVNNERAGLNQVDPPNPAANIGSGRSNEARSAPRAKIGSEPDSGLTPANPPWRRSPNPTEPDAGTDARRWRVPDAGRDTVPARNRRHQPDDAEVARRQRLQRQHRRHRGTRAVVARGPRAPVKQQADVIEYPFLVLPARDPPRRWRLVERGP